MDFKHCVMVPTAGSQVLALMRRLLAATRHSWRALYNAEIIRKDRGAIWQYSHFYFIIALILISNEQRQIPIKWHFILATAHPLRALAQQHISHLLTACSFQRMEHS
jgi:hypothetical protein